MYDVKCNFLNYLPVFAMIPKHPLDKAKEKQVNKLTFLSESAFHLSLNTVIDFHKMRNRNGHTAY